MHASNVTGNLFPLKEIGAFCKDNQILFVVDASQTAGAVPIDVERDHIGVLCFTGHKGLMGPQGTGGICICDNVMVEPLKVGGSGMKSFDKEHPKDMPEALEAGTQNAHGIAGLHAALEYLTFHKIELVRQKEMDLCKRFYNGVKDIPGIHVY